MSTLLQVEIFDRQGVTEAIEGLLFDKELGIRQETSREIYIDRLKGMEDAHDVFLDMCNAIGIR